MGRLQRWVFRLRQSFCCPGVNGELVSDVTAELMFLRPPYFLQVHQQNCRALQGCQLNLYTVYISESPMWVVWELFYICYGDLMVLPMESAAYCLETCRQPPSNTCTTKCNCKAIPPINGSACMTSVSQTKHTFGNGVLSFKLGKCVRGFVSFSVCILHVHNAGSAESSLHRLLAYLTALLSSLISSVNASLWLIENELVCLPAVPL